MVPPYLIVIYHILSIISIPELQFFLYLFMSKYSKAARESPAPLHALFCTKSAAKFFRHCLKNCGMRYKLYVNKILRIVCAAIRQRARRGLNCAYTPIRRQTYEQQPLYPKQHTGDKQLRKSCKRVRQYRNYARAHFVCPFRQGRAYTPHPLAPGHRRERAYGCGKGRD